MMRALADAGVIFSAGPLNVSDSDYALARRLAAVCIAEAPYAPVSAESLAEARRRMLAARTIFLCPTPLGSGNILLIEAALAARREGRTVALLEPTANGQDDAEGVLASVGARDFSGRGSELYRQLLANGCPIVTTPAAALRLLER